ncbi:MAG: ATP-binding protein [Desulfovibrionaceae bacterium]
MDRNNKGNWLLQQKKYWELFFIIISFIVIVLTIWVEFTFFRLNLYSFLIVLNINLLLLFVTFFVVLRKLTRLVLERRRKILGSHLRTRLVLSFVFVSFIPVIFIILIFSQIVSTSVNYWFSTQVESTLEKSSVLGNTFFNNVEKSLQDKAEHFVTVLEKNKERMTNIILDSIQKAEGESFYIARVDRQTIVDVQNGEDSSHISKIIEQIAFGVDLKRLDVKKKISFLEIMENKDFIILLYQIPKNISIQKQSPEYIILGEHIGEGFVLAQREINDGVEEYRKIHTLKDPIKFSFFYLSGILALLIILGSVWYGLRISKEIIAPIVDLADAFHKISRGNLLVTLNDDLATEEMEFLCSSFNDMAKELALTHARITDANAVLERKNEEIEIQKAHIETIIENITTGVIYLDVDNVVCSINQAALSLLEIEHTDIVGKRIGEILPTDSHFLLEEMKGRSQTVRHNKWQKQIYITVKNVKKKMLVTGITLHNSSLEEGSVIVFDDITELDQSHRIEAWREVAKRIAHEIKNPLTPIKLSAQRLEKKYAVAIGDIVFSQCTRQIIQQVEYLQQLVTEFSRFAKLPEIVLKEGNIASLLEETILFFHNTYPNIEFIFEKCGEIPLIDMDASAMQRVFMNIITNAVEALEGTLCPCIMIQIEYQKKMKSIYIFVEDNGKGIGEQEIHRLFEPYFSQKKEGTGLGLTIVKSIITDHQGYIRAQSTSAGTIMKIELPIRV